MANAIVFATSMQTRFLCILRPAWQQVALLLPTPCCKEERASLASKQGANTSLVATQEQHRQRPILPMPPDIHRMFGVAPRPLAAAPLRLRFGPFLPGRPLPRSDGEEEAATFSSTSALFQLHRPPTQTEVGLHLRSRLLF